MLSFPGNYCSWIFDTVEPVCKVGIDVYHLSGGMSWKLVFELAESAENCGMSSLLVNRYSDGFFAASWAGEDCGEFLFDDSNYSASSSPQLKRLSAPRGVEVNIYLWSWVSQPFFVARLSKHPRFWLTQSPWVYIRPDLINCHWCARSSSPNFPDAISVLLKPSTMPKHAMDRGRICASIIFDYTESVWE